MNSVEIAEVLIIRMKNVVHSRQVIQQPIRWEKLIYMFLEMNLVDYEFSNSSVHLFMSSIIYQFSYLSCNTMNLK